MSSYFLCPAGKRLLADVNEQFPKRDKRSDGWIGDPSHQARKSEHNPCWSCSGRNYGIVLAVDIDIDDGNPNRDLRRELLNQLIGDPRVWYVISNGKIYSRTYGWVAKPYFGNPHTGHVHVSFRIEKAWDNRPFFEADRPKPVKPRYLDISKLREEMLRVVVQGKPTRYSVDVRRYQRLLNDRLGLKLKLDGYAGAQTLNASAQLEKRFGGGGRPRVPDAITIKRANQGMFTVVA